MKILQRISLDVSICQFLHPYLTLFSYSQAKEKKTKTNMFTVKVASGFFNSTKKQGDTNDSR